MIFQYGVIIVALMVAAGEMGVPIGIPLEVALLLAGAYTVHSGLALAAGLVLVSLADTLGTTVLYVGVRLGSGRLHHWLARRAVEDRQMRRWERRLHDYGARTVFVGRMLPMVRMYITIAAGLSRLPARQFFLGEIPAGSIWAGAPLAVGYFFRDDVRNLIGTYASFSHAATFILPALGPFLALVWWIQRGPTTVDRIRRLRATLSLAMTLVIVAYVIDQGRHLVEIGGGVLPVPLVVGWLIILAAISVVLLIIGWTDLRATARRLRLPDILARPLPAGLKTTALWLALILVAGGIMVGIITHYPALSLPFP